MGSKMENVKVVKPLMDLFKSKGLVCEKIESQFNIGMLDIYVGGKDTNLWIEAKYVPEVPVRGTSKFFSEHKFTVKQKDKALEFKKAGVKTIGVVGVGTGKEFRMYILDPEYWDEGISKDDFYKLSKDFSTNINSYL